MLTMNQLTEDTFILYAMNCYDNPACHDVSEFEEDLKRFQYLRKLFNRYKQVGELRERLILNHLVVLYNIFGHRATNMLYLRLEGLHEYLKPFIDYLNHTTDLIEYNGKIVHSAMVKSDPAIQSLLRKL
jgi:hypothetical protein